MINNISFCLSFNDKTKAQTVKLWRDKSFCLQNVYSREKFQDENFSLTSIKICIAILKLFDNVDNIWAYVAKCD